MRSQETPVSGLTMHLLLMHFRQWGWRFSIRTPLLFQASVLPAEKASQMFNPGLVIIQNTDGIEGKVSEVFLWSSLLSSKILQLFRLIEL